MKYNTIPQLVKAECANYDSRDGSGRKANHCWQRDGTCKQIDSETKIKCKYFYEAVYPLMRRK